MAMGSDNVTDWRISELVVIEASSFAPVPNFIAQTVWAVRNYLIDKSVPGSSRPLQDWSVQDIVRLVEAIEAPITAASCGGGQQKIQKPPRQRNNLSLN